MSAAVESMAYVGDVPWHGLGTQVDENISLREFQRQAGLDWMVQKTPVMFDAPDHERTEFGGVKLTTFKDKYVLNRTTDHKPFAVVSGRYKPVQPEEIFDFFHELLAVQGMKMHTAGSLKDGGRIWCLAKTGDMHRVLGRDEIDSYLLLCTSYDLSLATTAQFTSVRVVCNNTLQQSLDEEGKSKIVIPHAAKFNADEVKDALGIGRDQWYQFTKALDNMAAWQVSDATAHLVLNRVFNISDKPEEFMVDPNRVHVQNILDMYVNGTGMGADIAGRTAWGLLNCVTEYIDYHKRARGQGNRLDSAWFGPGAALKHRTMMQLLKLVA